MAKSKQIKALVLFSGGLDSMLVIKILEDQGIQTDLYTFNSFFFNNKQAQKSAQTLGKKLYTIDIAKKHLKIVKHPQFGHGKGLNPCTDCHLLMLKEVKKIFQKEKYDILATGEVMGQRPKSQQNQQLKLIEKKARLKNKILRPLSALLLEETEFEKKQLVKREKLFAISGRSRKNQIALTKKFHLKNYPSPAGGCILTDPLFAKNLYPIINYKINQNDIDLTRSGRNFNSNNAKIIIGRNYEENKKILNLAQKKDILMEAQNIPGPLTLIRFYGKLNQKEKAKIIQKSAKLTKSYSTKTKNLPQLKIQYWHKGNKKTKKIIII